MDEYKVEQIAETCDMTVEEVKKAFKQLAKQDIDKEEVEKMSKALTK